VSKSKTIGFINESLHQPDGIYDSYEEETASDQTVLENKKFKRFSCFNFTNCNPDINKTSNQLKLNLISEECIGNSHPIHLRDQNRVTSSSSIFTKVRQRIVNLNRRSTPANFASNIKEECLSKDAVPAVARSMTDYNIVSLNKDSVENDELLTHEENPLKIRKFGFANRFTKSPALYDLHLYTNEDPELQTKKISDLLEEKEETNSYEEYENDYDNNDATIIQQLDPDPENFMYTTSQYNRFQHSGSLSTSTNSFSTSEHSYAQDKLIPPPVYPLEMNKNKSDLDSIIFIDDGQSEYISTSTFDTSGSSSQPSLEYSSFRGSESNISRLILKQNNDMNNNYEVCRVLARKTDSNQFLNEVNRKLAKYVKNKSAKLSSNKFFSKLPHSETFCTVDISRNYDEQFNDKISIFSNTKCLTRKAPLADSESTTLSNSNENLLNSNSLTQFRIFNSKYPLVSKLLNDYQSHLHTSNQNNNF